MHINYMQFNYLHIYYASDKLSQYSFSIFYYQNENISLFKLSKIKKQCYLYWRSTENKDDLKVVKYLMWVLKTTTNLTLMLF